MKAQLIKIREIEVNRTLYHLSGSMGEDTLCGIAFVDAEEDFEVQEGKEGTLQDVTCPKCLATAKYIRSIDERCEDDRKQLWKQRKMCKTCYNWMSQEDVGFDYYPHCSEADSDCIEYLTGRIKKCPKRLIM